MYNLQGFATFAEDFIHSNTLRKIQKQRNEDNESLEPNETRLFLSEDNYDELAMLRMIIRYKTLYGEVECTPKDHQIIRPMKAKITHFG